MNGKEADENSRLDDLKDSYAQGIISLEEFEEGVAEEMNQNVRGSDALNTTDEIGDQLWMSEEKTEKPDPAEMDGVGGEQHLPIKPSGGMWTSTYTPDEEYDSDWIRWCSTEGFYGGRHKWLMKPKDDLDVVVVDCLEDLRAVANIYEKDTYKGRPSSMLMDTVIDFETMAEDFDAMRLTKEGQWDTRMTPAHEPDLYGWDSESVLHFRWNWVDFEYLGESDITVGYD